MWIKNRAKRYNRKALCDFLKRARQEASFGPDTLSMMEAVLKVTETQVREIMVPRGRMMMIEQEMNFEQLLPVVLQSRHSRFPVIQNKNPDKIVGILLAKDLLHYRYTESSEHWCTVLRPAVFVPESKRVHILLHEFRQNRYHMAIVVDEFGGISGLVTIEDALEEIVGEITDEKDKVDVEQGIYSVGSGVYRVCPNIPMSDFNRFFDLQIADDDFETVGGFILHQLGRIPKSGECVTCAHLSMRIIQSSPRQLMQIEVVQTPDASGS